jgi:glutamate racemase
MKTKQRILSLMLVFFFLATNHVSFSQQVVPSLAKKKKITVVITDSGLGGIDVLADIARDLDGAGYYKKVNLVFANALFDEHRGYNSLAGREEKVSQFNDVLYGIERKYKPDIILVGCNTLSVLYESTRFVKEEKVPVRGIIEPGVRIIEQELSKHPEASVIITGTETTISEDSHRKALLRMGINPERIITQSCPELQSYIERAPEGEDTQMLISFYTEEALAKVQEINHPLLLSLNCSHFGYAENGWKSAFTAAGKDLAALLNPNSMMINYLLPVDAEKRFEHTDINMEVSSKVKINNMEAISELFRKNAPAVADALMNYSRDENLF